MVARALARDLGGDVERRPGEDLAPGERAVGGARLGETEVRHLDAVLALVEEEVRGLHVPMDEALRLRGREATRGLLHVADGAPPGERALALEELAEVAALDELHDEVRSALLLAREEDRDDVLVRDPGRRARLAHEAPRRALVLPEEGREHLDRDGPVERVVVALVDDAHAALAEAAEDAVRAELLRDRSRARLLVPERVLEGARTYLPRVGGAVARGRLRGRARVHHDEPPALVAGEHPGARGGSAELGSARARRLHQEEGHGAFVFLSLRGDDALEPQALHQILAREGEILAMLESFVS